MLNYIFDNDVSFVIFIFVAYLLVNFIFISIGRFFWAQRPNNNNNNNEQQNNSKPKRRSLLLALFFFIAIIVIDVASLVWLCTYGFGHLTTIIDFFESMADL